MPLILNLRPYGLNADESSAERKPPSGKYTESVPTSLYFADEFVAVPGGSNNNNYVTLPTTVTHETHSRSLAHARGSRDECNGGKSKREIEAKKKRLKFIAIYLFSWLLLTLYSKAQSHTETKEKTKS